jgi:hypothetical protein
MPRFHLALAALLMGAGLSSVSAAQDAAPAASTPPTFAEVGLAWVRGPKIGDMARFYPTRARVLDIRRGLAAVDCTPRADGKLDCVVAKEDPAEVFFGEAALNTMKRVTVRAVDGGSPEGRTFRFTLKFGHWPPSTLPAYAQLGGYGLRWTKTPPVMNHWNGAGLPKGESFSVEVECVLDVAGVPACEITDQAGASKGYATAVLKAMADARVKTLDGSSTEGRTFTHRITMSID